MKKREQIMNCIKSSSKPMSVSDVAARSGTSLVYASRVLKASAKDGLLSFEKVGNRVYYRMTDGIILLNQSFVNFALNEGEILEKVRRDARFVSEVREGARAAFEFAFPEMLNNAIEHSKSERITVMVRIMQGELEFVIRDFGIGVFRNIRIEKGLNSEYDAIRELIKGKHTTAPRAHTGMGIFFTSKMADIFELTSYDLSLEVNNRLADIFVRDIEEELTGTEVKFKIDVESKRSVSEVFRSYSVDPEEGDFDKTYIPVKLYRIGTVYVSRSQARALLANLDNFRKITLDFEGVDTVGQAFADEIFRVYAINHPGIEIEYVNANKNVEFMISLAKNGLKREI